MTSLLMLMSEGRGRSLGGLLLLSSVPGVSAASSAQRHAVPSLQKPHESITALEGTGARIEDDELEVVNGGGRLLVVKSISVSSG